MPSRTQLVACLPIAALGLMLSACGNDTATEPGAGATTAVGGAGGAGASGGSTTSSGGSGGSAAGGTGGTGGAIAGCPPPGPYGTEVADVAPDVTLHDCAGNTVQLHGLCSRTAAFLYAFAAW